MCLAAGSNRGKVDWNLVTSEYHGGALDNKKGMDGRVCPRAPVRGIRGLCGYTAKDVACDSYEA